LGWGIFIKGNNNSIDFSSKCRLKNVKIEIHGNKNKLVLNEKVIFYENAHILIEGSNCKINIGKATTIGSADIFCGESNTQIEIGKDCMLSRNIRMNTSDFHSIINQDSGKRINPPQDIEIGNHVWIGNSTFIGKGVKVGNDTIIASRAFVSGKSYPDNSVIGGLPAKVLKENVNWSREKLPY
jgi:acetyltransferase-like isoleucine patch superfamily enzyme